jgi:hypothetical protein
MTQVIWVINGTDINNEYIETVHYSVIAQDETEEAEIYHSTDIIENQVDKNISNQDLVIILKNILQDQVSVLEQQAIDRLAELITHIR